MSGCDRVQADPPATRGRPAAKALAAALAVLLVGLSVACAPPPTPTDPYRLRASLGDGEIVLSWIDPAATPTPEFDVQTFDPSLGWTDLADATTTSTSITGLTNRVRYTFRVRTAAHGTTPPGAWSRSVPLMYVELVLPIIRIETENAAPVLDKENYVRGSMTLDPNGSGYAPYSGTLGIRGRGNSTWKYPKKPYRIKLDTKASLMGIASERDWVLLANFVDQSQLRTWTAGEAGRATDLPFTPTYRYVEVVFNGDYLGVYQLAEHMEVGKDRIDIVEMGSGDNAGTALTGGYRLEIDDRLEENNEPGFRTNRSVPIVVKDPDPMTTQQRNYIRSYVQAFENSLFSANFTDPVTGYRQFLDVDSFIDHYLVQEVTRNQDVFWSSTFFTKERGESQFKFGPIWDFDRSMGTIKGSVEAPPEGWRARGRGPWSNQIFKDPTFVQAVIERWDELKPAFDQIPPQLVPLGQSLRPAIDNDAARWSFSVHETDEPEFLRDWLTARIAWMDSQFHPGD